MSFEGVSKGYRHELEHRAARGPTQEEAQARKMKRERWIRGWLEKEHLADTRRNRDDAMSYLPESLAA